MKHLFLTLSSMALLTACGGGGSDSSGAPTLVGQFIDSPVANVAYRTSSGLSGTTDAEGQFNYRAGDTVRMSIGRVLLGEARASETLTPLDLVGAGSDIDHPKVVKLLQLLQTLDEDNNSSNGIRIADAVVSRLAALPAEVRAQDVTDLVTEVITRAYASNPPALRPAPEAKAHFAESLNALAARARIARLGGVANVVIGGGGKNCSSFNGDTQSTNCAADWTTILAQDPAFAGLTKADISFDANYVFPTFTYALNQAGLDRLAAVPAALFDATRKANVTSAIQSRLALSGPRSGLSFTAFDGSQPVEADGLAFWNTSSDNDFNTLLDTVCPGNCTLSDANIDAVNAASFDSADQKADVLLILRYLQTTLGTNPIPYNSGTPNFRSAFRASQLAADGTPAAGLTAALTQAENAILRTAFTDSPAATPRKLEARTVKFLGERHSKAIYEQIVSAARAVAGGRQPTIGVVTASADNAYFDHDINVTAFRSAGANVVYLPLNGGLRRAIDANDCANLPYYYDSFSNTGTGATAFHMDLAFPDIAQPAQAFCANGAATLNSTIQTLHGVYFSGGDQARHLEALTSRDGSNQLTVQSEQLRLLKARYDAGQLVVSGTSAGNHAQGGGVWKNRPVPMIGGGDSHPALVKGFVAGNGAGLEDRETPSLYAQGGLGFFRFGLLDSHFSQRTREGRLARVTHETGMDYGFGVDENTALIVGRTDRQGRTAMAVIGAGGVFVVDVRNATASGNTGGTYAISGVRAHYVTAGDTIEIDSQGQLSVRLDRAASTKPLLPEQAVAAVTATGVQDYGSANFQRMARAMGLQGAPRAVGATSQTAPVYEAVLERTANTEFRGRQDSAVAYTNVLLSFAPRP
ncbi:cyanophycinase [Hydrogenophaga sp. XSHU_21]